MVRNAKRQAGAKGFLRHRSLTSRQNLCEYGAVASSQSLLSSPRRQTHRLKLVHIYMICYMAKNDDGKKPMDELGKLQQFRAERSENNVLHLVFDMPGRPMNVFSNAAIAELALFSQWLRYSAVKGVVIRSGKSSAFCAGADLGELGLAYDMIMAAPAETRDRVAFEHFFPLSLAMRGIETAGKPVAAALAGLALRVGGRLGPAA